MTGKDLSGKVEHFMTAFKAISAAAIGLAAIAITPPATAQAAPNGKAAFAPCAVCHGIKPAEKRLGPSMFGIVGRASAAQAGFTYSPALTKAKITWTKAELDAFLKAPMKKVPGTRMAFAGVPDDAKRAALIDYLSTLK
jgi:cytochrome c